MATTIATTEKKLYAHNWDNVYDDGDNSILIKTEYFPKTSFFFERPKLQIRKTSQASQIVFNIDDKIFRIDHRLINLLEIIRVSERLLYLNDDWDEDGAIQINKIIYFRGIETLIDYATNVLHLYNIAIKPPHISAGRDGSIDLDWSSPNATLLITILNTPDLNLHYYGDDGNNNTVIKGIIKEAKINDDLSYWMRKL